MPMLTVGPVQILFDAPSDRLFPTTGKIADAFIGHDIGKREPIGGTVNDSIHLFARLGRKVGGFVLNAVNLHPSGNPLISRLVA